MPTLPTASDVIALTGTDMPDAVVESIIDDAALFAEGCIASYSAERQTAIIKWIAAHMVQSTSGGGSLQSQKLGDASETYARSSLSGDGLKGTHYGQQAIGLDPSGCLARKGRAPASVQVI